MNKPLLNKYNLAIKLLEIQCQLEQTFGSEQTDDVLEVGTSQGRLEIPLDATMRFINSNACTQLRHLKEKFINNMIDKNDLEMILFNMKICFNEGIGEYTELFWQHVKERNLNFKRKNNRLLNIVKKNYVTRLEDVEIFFPNIQNLISSKIYSKAYSKEQRIQIDKICAKTKADYIGFLRNLKKKTKISESLRIKSFQKLDILTRHNYFFKANGDEINEIKRILQYDHYAEKSKKEFEKLRKQNLKNYNPNKDH